MEYILIFALIFLILFGFFKILEIIANVASIVGLDYVRYKFKPNVIILIIVVALFLCLSFWIIPLLVHKFHWFDFFLLESQPSDDIKHELLKANEIGDAFGGTLGPFIAFIGAVFTGLAFWAQYKANQQQKRDLERERFENRYFELIRFHKANIEELKLNQAKGKECFACYFAELRLIYRILETCISNIDEVDEEFKTPEFISKISYHVFLMGIEFAGKYTDSRSESKIFVKFKEAWSILERDGNNQSEQIADLFEVSVLFDHNEYSKIKYLPFQGHINQLGHYYRNLFQTVKYVVNQPINLFVYEEKLQYLSMLRAQLSNHEQLMLYYNGIGGPGEPWFKHEYFTKYKMIHNLPLSFANFGIKPEENPEIIKSIEYWKARGQQLFEWHEGS